MTDPAFLAEHLVRALSRAEVLAIGGFTAVAALGGTLALPPVMQRIVLRPWREKRLGDLIPVDSVLDDGFTLRCVDGTLVVTIEIWGVDTQSLEGGARAEIRTIKNALLIDLAKLGIQLRKFAERRRRPFAAQVPVTGNPRRQAFADKWAGQFDETMVTRHVVVLSVRAGSSQARTRLGEAARVALEYLRPFGARVLSQGGAPDGRSDLLSFWHGIANPAAGERFPPVSTGIGHAIATTPITTDYQGDGRLEAVAGDRIRHGYAISINALPEEGIGDDALTGLLVLPVELTIVQHILPLEAAMAELLLRQRQRQAANTYVSAAAAQQYELVHELVAPGSPAQTALCRYATTVFAWGRTKEEALAAKEAVRMALRHQRFAPADEVSETATMWWAQWPSFDDQRFMREHLLTSQAVANLMTLERPPIGLLRCDWGEGAALRAQTAQGTPYAVNLHQGEEPEQLAHTVIFGPPGTGKTTLAVMLALGALTQFAGSGFRARFFDRLLGQFVAVTAHGGRYVTFDEAGPSDAARTAGFRGNLQPFRRELTPARRQHILQLLRLMAGPAGGSPKASEQFDHALRMIGRLDAHQRDLQQIVSYAFSEGTDLQRAMRQWLPGGAYGGLFAGDDRTGLADSDLVAFDMTSVLQDKVLAPVVVADLAFEIKIAALAEARPGMIVLDECKALFSNAEFQREVMVWLDELRKARQAVVTMWQGPGQIPSAVEDSLRRHSATHIFFRDPSVHPSDYERWNLTRREIAWLRGEDARTAHMPYACLLKKPAIGESVVIDLDLRRLGRDALLFKSGAAYSSLAATCQADAEAGGLDWVSDYLVRAAALAGDPMSAAPSGTDPGSSQSSRIEGEAA